MEIESTNQIAVIAGATGLVGDHCLQKLINSGKYKEIRVISRKTISYKSQKVTPVIISDFEDITLQKDLFVNVDSVFCCLGTTIKKAGSKEQFTRVDLDYVVLLGKLAEKHRAKRFLVISAVGVKPDSSVFYNQVKGKMEVEISKLNIPAIAFFKPSLLYGNRDEYRFGEKIGSYFMKLISPLLFGKLSKYKGIQAKDVAGAMVKKSLENFRGISFLHYTDMQKLINKRTS